MGYRLKSFPKEDQEAFKGKHELAEPKDWAIMDGAAVYAFYDTEEQAQAELAQLRRDDRVHDLFSEWRSDTAKQLGISEEEVEQIIRQRY